MSTANETQSIEAIEAMLEVRKKLNQWLISVNRSRVIVGSDSYHLYPKDGIFGEAAKALSDALLVAVRQNLEKQLAEIDAKIANMASHL